MAESRDVKFCEEPKRMVQFSDLDSDNQQEFLNKRNIFFQGNQISLKELLTPLRNIDLDKVIDSDLLAKLTNNENVSVGPKLMSLNEDIQCVYMPRTFNQGKVFEQDVCKIDDNQFVAIMGSPGSGKSTFLQSLALNIKTSHSDLWVMRIDLNDYSKALSDLKERKFVSTNILDLLNSRPETKMGVLEKEIFSIPGKVVLLLDGVDEVCYGCEDFILGIIQDCKNMSRFVKIYITCSSQLGKTLNTSWKIFTLDKLSRDDQVALLEKHWEAKFNVQNKKEKCKMYVKKLITEGWITESAETIFGVPLQIRILAEMLETRDNFDDKAFSDWEGFSEFLTSRNSEPSLPKNASLIELCQLFIHKKCSKRKSKLSENLIRSDIAKINEECDYYLYIIALETILNKEQCQFFTCYRNSSEKIPENLRSFGILKKVDNSFQFTHRIFAEYFLAECISAELLRTQTEPFLAFLANEVLSGHRFAIARMFLDSFIPIDWNSLSEKMLTELGHLLRQSDDLFEVLAKDYGMGSLKFVVKCLELVDVSSNIDGIRREGDSVLHTVIKEDHSNTLQFLVKKGASIHSRDRNDRTVLHLAAAKDDLTAIKFLVQHGAEINSKDDQGRTPFHEAIAFGSLDAVKYLLTHGAMVNSRDRKGRTALHEAAKIGDFDKVKFLVENGVELNSKAKDGSALFDAVRRGNLDIVKYLLENGAEVNFRDARGNIVLHTCMEADQNIVEMVRLLLERGLDVNSVDKEGNTVLHLVVNKEDRVDLVELLVEKGADVCRSNRKCNTALDLAIKRGAVNIVAYLMEIGAPALLRDESIIEAVQGEHLNVIKYLAKKGVDLNIIYDDNMDRYTTLHYAVYTGNVDIVKFLVETYGDMGSGTERATALRYVSPLSFPVVRFMVEHGADMAGTLLNAIRQGNLKVIEFLVERGATVGEIDEVGDDFDTIRYLIEHGFHVNKREMLHRASQYGNLSAVKYLVERGANVNDASEAYCDTPLYRAASANHLHVVRFLVERGADISAKDDVGNTPASKAIDRDNAEVAQFLIENWSDASSEALHDCLVAAIERSNLNLVKLIAERCPQLDLEDTSEDSIIYATLRRKNLDIMDCLAGRDRNVKGKAVDMVERLLKHHDNAELIRRMLSNSNAFWSLLRRGLPLDAGTIDRIHLLHEASKGGDLKLVRCLVEKAADVNNRDFHGFTPLHVSANLSVSKFLIENGADVNARAYTEDTVLHQALKEKDFDTCKLLIDQGADVNVTDREGLTPLDIAVAAGSFSKVAYLVEKGADRRKTALEGAARSGDFDLVKFLVQSGFEIDGEVVKAAVTSGNLDLVKFLLDAVVVEDLGDIFRHAVTAGDLDIAKYVAGRGAKLNADDSVQVLCEIATTADLEMMKFLLRGTVDVATIGGNGRTVLHEAAKSGGLSLIKIALESGARSIINVKDKDGRTALHEAVENKHPHVAKLLIEHGADVHVRDANGYTLLHNAIARKQEQVATCLVEGGAEVDARSGKGRTALQEAAARGCQGIARLLIEHGADVNVKDDDGRTALHEEAGNGRFFYEAQLRIMQLLTQRGADIDAKCAKGRTPLHEAATKCDPKKVAFLVEKGADVNAETETGDTPLSCALKSPYNYQCRNKETNIDLVECLVGKGARLDMKTDGRTLLHYAAARGDQKVVEYLVEKGLDLTSKADDGRTLLHEAVKSTNLALMKYLIRKGLEVNAKTTNGWTPIHEAQEECDLPVLEYLVEMGADVNAKTDNGRTPLHEAVESASYLGKVEFLVKAGAVVDVQDHEGKTPLDIAEEDCMLDPIADFLRSQ